MVRDDDYWAGEFPALFVTSYVDYAACHVGFTTRPVPEPLVARLHLVTTTQDGDVIVCRSTEGRRFLPGGTREAGETLVELARRELLEEAGARITDGVTLFASQVADSVRDRPYRPHLPHPRSYWGYGITRADLVQPPTNPRDDEQVVEVLTLPPIAAASYLQAYDPIHADVIRLADAMALL